MATVVRKQAAEKLRIAIDFEDKLNDATAEIISVDALTATSLGLIDGSGELTISGTTISGQTVTFLADGGTSGEAYSIRCVITDADDQEHEGDGTVFVIEIAAATITVEDGTVVTDANTYASVATADAYLRLRARADTWDTLTPAVKAGRLVQASSYLDAKVAWRGDPVDEDQTMQWPRSGATDRNGVAIASNVVPLPVVHAAIEVAVLGEITTEAERETTEETVGPISVKYARGDVTQSMGRYGYALSLLKGLYVGGSATAVVTRA